MKKVLLYVCLGIISLFISPLLRAQDNPQFTITGKIISLEGGGALAGVSITIKGNKEGVTTKEDGTYVIKAFKGQTIVFSSVGYEKQEFKVKKSEKIDLALKIAAIDAQEVVVIGYGTRKKSHLTGSVSKVTTDEAIGEIPVSRADDALKGKLAGVSILTTDAQAGAAPTIQIRGATSITAGTSPLIVVDGYPVPTDLSAIDMNDVESIEVLKDAASAAIYGSRGGNGVILITTKSGKVGKPRISANISTGIKSLYRKIPYFKKLQDWKARVLQDSTFPGFIVAPEILFAEKFDAKNDVQDIIFRDVKYTNLQLSISGGTQTAKYYLSANGLLDDGIMIGNDYKRFGLKAGFSAKVTPKTTIDFSFTPSYTEIHNVPVDVQSAARMLPSWVPMYHTDSTSKYTGMAVGSYTNQRDFQIAYNPNYTGPVNIGSGSANNPLEQLEGTSDKTSTIRSITNFSVKIDFSKYFSFKSSYGLLTSAATREMFQKSWATTELAIDGDVKSRASSQAILTEKKAYDFSNENIFTYKRIFNKHDLNVIGGFSNQYTNTSYFSGTSGNFATDDIPTLNAGTMQSLTSTIQEEALVSFLMRINYAYDNKYLLSVSERSDGSSRFGPDNKYASFPSVSAGWKISNEKFFPENKYVNDVKLRASWGATGNKNIGNYTYYANVTPANASLGDQQSPGYQLTSFGNDTLRWERTFSTNVGADLGLFNNKIRVGFDYYYTVTDRLLLNMPTPASTGFTTYTTNKGKVANQGIELEISAPIINSKDFKWNISANCYTNKNTLLDFGGTPFVINTGDPKRPNFFITKVGQPLTQYFGYQADSAVQLRQTPNFYRSYWPIGVTPLHTFVKDQNNDNTITDADRVVIGDPYPKFNWGFTSNMQYKSFDISFTIQGSHGAKVFNIDPYYYENRYNTQGSTAYTNPDLYTPAQQSQVRQKTQTNTDIQDASFIALRNLNIGYTLPAKLLKKISLSRVRLYLSSANLWYHFADSYTSYNPEGDNGFPNDPLRKGYQRGCAPIARTITFGTNIEF